MSKAVIVGGGIGGLAAAIALLRRGWEVEVLERAAGLGEVGAGLSLWPNALRALDALGVGDEVRARAREDGGAVIGDPRGRGLARSDMAAVRARYGLPIMIHRADLLDILRTAVPESSVRTGISVIGASTDGVVTHAGGEVTGDLIVGADGIRSVVRRAVCGDLAPRYAGYTAWRIVVTPHAPITELRETWGRGERFGYTPLPDGRVYCFATANLPAGADVDATAEMRRRFASWHAPIPALLDAIDPAAVLSHDIYELPPLPRFVAGRVALLGDAAHAMTPNLGQGACQALEDTVVLAACTGDLARYDRERRARTRMIAARSARVGRVAQLSSPPVVAVRDLILRLTPVRVQVAALAPVLDWSC